MNFIVVHLVFFPRPVYTGPDLVTYFRGPNLEVYIFLLCQLQLRRDLDF